jgi:hypothetical protein
MSVSEITRGMDQCGIEPENRTRVLQVVATLKRAGGFKTFDFLTVGESHVIAIKFFGPDPSRCTAHKVLAPLVRECIGIKEATVHYSTEASDPGLQLHVEVLKRGRSGIARMEPRKLDRNYLASRLRERGADAGMPKRLLSAIVALTSTVITYTDEHLESRLKYARGESRCTLSFLGIRCCRLSFIECLFESTGRHLVDVTFASELCGSGKLERTLVLSVDVSRDSAPFPKRKDVAVTDGSAPIAKKFKPDSAASE